MKYMIGKIKSNFLVSELFSSDANIFWKTDIFYESLEMAESAVQKYQSELDKNVQLEYDQLSRENRESVDKKLKKPNTCYRLAQYIIVPVASLVVLQSNPIKGDK